MTESFKEIYSHYNRIIAHHEASRYPFYYLKPFIIDNRMMNVFQKLKNLFLKAINRYIDNYQDYNHIIDFPDRVHKILEMDRQFGQQIGAFRPDFIIDHKGQIKFVEINARYFDGYLLSGITEKIMEKKCGCYSYIDGKKPVDLLIEYIFTYFADYNKIVFIKGAVNDGDNRYYLPLFEKLGIEVIRVRPNEIAANSKLFRDAAVISHMNQREINKLGMAEIEILSSAKMLNSLTTIFLVHDKRFLAVLSDKNFQKTVFDSDEIDFISPYIIPTFTRRGNHRTWEMARKSRKDWILKPFDLDRSDGIVPGNLVDDKTWEFTFESRKIERMVLQPIIHQKTFSGKTSIDGKIHTDYLTGGLMFFDEQFFGPGEFRASSQPVVNWIKDDRKIFPWITDDYAGFKGDYFSL